MIVTNVIINVRFEVFSTVFTGVLLFRDMTSALYVYPRRLKLSNG